MKYELPTPASANIKTYKEALNYASYDGALRSNYILYHKRNLKFIAPYEGYKFVELSSMCDPYIFCNRVNKFCLRYSVADLLPLEIVNYKIKRGNPGFTLSKVLNMSSNRKSLVNYLENHGSILVNSFELLQRLYNNNFDRNEFLGLSLLMFENILREKCGLYLNI